MPRFKIHWKFTLASIIPLLAAGGIATGVHFFFLADLSFWQILGIALSSGLIIALLFSLAFSRQVSLPLREMQSIAKKLSRGQFGDKLRLESRDEVYELGTELNEMAEELGDRITALSEDRARFAAILSGMVEGVMILDSQGMVLMINPALEEMFGLKSQEIVDRAYLEVLRHSSLIEFIRITIESQHNQSKELMIRTPRERFFYLQASVAPSGRNGEVCTVLVFHDITENKRLERVRQDFVANVSHELRTPLTAMKGYVEALLDGAKDDPEKNLEFLRIVQNHTDRLSNIVFDLLTLSQIESGQYAWKKEPIDVDHVIERAVDILRPIAERKKQRITTKIHPNLPRLTGDSEKLSQVLINLIDNSLKYTPENGSITIGAEHSGNGIEITIQDTGLGIPKKDLSRIFERFYRVDRARSRDLGGTGLGLSIVKHIVESHGGSVTVQSHPGQGSSFTVSLPSKS